MVAAGWIHSSGGARQRGVLMARCRVPVTHQRLAPRDRLCQFLSGAGQPSWLPHTTIKKTQASGRILGYRCPAPPSVLPPKERSSRGIVRPLPWPGGLRIVKRHVRRIPWQVQNKTRAEAPGPLRDREGPDLVPAEPARQHRLHFFGGDVSMYFLFPHHQYKSYLMPTVRTSKPPPADPT